ncbi:hypothetical protein PUNSTDRAFT_136526 [Punctularia strigosozonata HHB-11173 SS5]|uniref:uncharacterized protein n=1 Tax=Punctularia strigosozonata (strain HHB-11173) TaxID=741275 RepID=UPI00044184F0|nr:uncharacterized protein PUNSTDRAFT_136526 [Punctularia strigosozonata HHB-11173 SS5]EIN06683.1 hypothetical protein PUNSTDRAFT_136526 [Punctularia strigosozonata HHB-11173 SS5]
MTPKTSPPPTAVGTPYGHPAPSPLAHAYHHVHDPDRDTSDADSLRTSYGFGPSPSASCASLTSLTTPASSHYSQAQSPLHTRSFVVKKPLPPTPTSAPPLAVPSSPSSTSLVSVFRTASLDRFRRSKSKAKERPKKEPATPEDTVRVDYPYIGAHLDRERSAVPPPPEHAYTHGLPDPHLPLPPHNVRWQVAHSPLDVRAKPHRSRTDPDADPTPVTPPSEFSARFQAWGKARAHQEEDRASREIFPAPEADAPRSSTCSYSESDEQQTLRGRRAPPCALLPRPPSDLPTSFVDLDVDEEACASTLTPPPTPGRLDELVPSKDNVLVFTLDVGEEADARMVRLDDDVDVDPVPSFAQQREPPTRSRSAQLPSPALLPPPCPLSPNAKREPPTRSRSAQLPSPRPCLAPRRA